MNLWHTNKSLRHSVKQIALISTFASATFASVANEGVVFSGQVKTVTPTVTIEADDGAVAHVKDFSLSVIQDALECELYTEVWQTQNSFAEDEKPRCLFEWTGSVNGLTVDSLALEGILNTADTAGFEYQVSILDQGQKRVIVTDTYELPVGSPEISNIVDIVANWSNEQEAGLTQENYDKNNRLTSAFVEVEPRPFTQVVTFRGANCTVEAEQNGCTVTFDSLRPGEGAPESFGSLVEQITATDEKNYLELQTRNFVIDYDYRSPEVVDFVVNGVGEMAPIDYSVDDQDYVLQENKAMLVLRTPHYDKPGDWWFPEVEDIELIIDSTIATEYLVQIKGETYEYEVNSVLARSSYEINPSGEPTIINDKIVFFYDVSGIPDGRFTANIKASDKYNNTREVGIPENLFDRNAPQIIGLFDVIEVANDRQVEVVFMEDFTFLAVGGWADGSRISSVNIAGRELNYDVIEDNIVSLLPDETLVPGTEYTIEVVAEDDSANSITREFNIMYSPAQFRVSDVPEQVFAYTHRFSGRLSQSAGKKCRFSTTPEVAIASSTAFYKGCVVTFPTIPEGVTTSLRRSSVDFYGNINMEGTINVPYEVVYYNRDGLSKSVFEGSFTVESLPTPPISLTMLDENQVQEGIYSLPYNAKRITKFEVVGTSGEIKVTTQAGSQSNEKTVRGTRRFGMREMKMRLERLDTEETKVWDMVPYTVSALHTNIPDEVATETFNVLITPHSGTRAYLDIEAIPDGTTEDEYAVSIRAGIYNRREKTYIYDAQTMGMWTAQLGYTQRREIVPFGDIFELDENGEATTVMSGQEMFDINSRFVVILRSVSPVEGFDKEIVSRPQFVRVLKGEAVEGDINKNEIVDRVPFRVRAKYSYASRDDSRVAGDRTWQVSYDGENFADIPESQSTTYSFSVTDPSTAFYRYKVVNAYTGAEGYSSIMKVVGYDVPDLTLGGPRTLLRDQQGEFTVTVNDEVYTAEDMTFEWSLDNGETWNEDATSITHQAAENFLVQVRARLDNSADEVGSRAYDTASRSVKIIPPEPVKIRIDGARYGEVGFAYELEASVSHDRDLVAQDIVSEWRLPDGTVVEDTSISHTISEEDVVEKYVTFTFAAWIRDYKEETLREVNKRVFAHHYIFPEGRMGAGTRVAMAPSTGKAWVTRHDTSVPGVDFDYEWQVDDAVTILSQSSTRMSFQINEPGTHMISSIVRDNRGNEQLYTTFVEAMEIAPMEITVESQSSKENMRAPLTMRFKPSIRLKHPNDGVDYYEIEYDGEVKQTTSTYNYVDINEAGVHDVTFRVYSDFGQMGEVVMPIEVLPNLPPECAPAVEYRNERHYVYHNCTDDNLVNVHYAWEDGSFDDVGESLYFRNDNFPSETVTITATDLLGETTITTVSW